MMINFVFLGLLSFSSRKFRFRRFACDCQQSRFGLLVQLGQHFQQRFLGRKSDQQPKPQILPSFDHPYFLDGKTNFRKKFFVSSDQHFGSRSQLPSCIQNLSRIFQPQKIVFGCDHFCNSSRSCRVGGRNSWPSWSSLLTLRPCWNSPRCQNCHLIFQLLRHFISLFHFNALQGTRHHAHPNDIIDRSFGQTSAENFPNSKMCQKATPIFKISNLRSSFRRNNLLANVLGQLFPSDISSRRQSVCFHQICISQVDQPDLHLLHQRLDPPRPRLVVLRLGLSLYPTDRPHQRSQNLLRHPLCLHFLRPYSHFCQM